MAPLKLSRRLSGAYELAAPKERDAMEDAAEGCSKVLEIDAELERRWWLSSGTSSSGFHGGLPGMFMSFMEEESIFVWKAEAWIWRGEDTLYSDGRYVQKAPSNIMALARICPGLLLPLLALYILASLGASKAS